MKTKDLKIINTEEEYRFINQNLYNKYNGQWILYNNSLYKIREILMVTDSVSDNHCLIVTPTSLDYDNYNILQLTFNFNLESELEMFIKEHLTENKLNQRNWT